MNQQLPLVARLPPAPTGRGSLERLIGDVEEVKRRSLAPAHAAHVLAAYLGRYAAEHRLDSTIGSMRSLGRYPRRLLSPIGAEFQIVLALWKPGSASPIHDHNDTVGVVTALTGDLAETKYVVKEAGPSRVVLERSETTPMLPGVVSPILPDPSNQLHEMVNTGDGWAASVHLYLEPLHRYHLYELEPCGRFRLIETALWFDDGPDAP